MGLKRPLAPGPGVGCRFMVLSLAAEKTLGRLAGDPNSGAGSQGKPSSSPSSSP